MFGLFFLYLSFVLGFFFFLVGMVCFWLYDVIIKRRWNLMFLGSIVFMISIYFFVEYWFVYLMLFLYVLMYWIEFILFRYDVWYFFCLFVKNFVYGYNYVMIVYIVVIFLILLFVFVVVLFK